MTAPRPRPPRPLTVRECADAMHVSKMTVYRLIHDGILPAFQIRRQFRVPANELDRYMRDAQVIPDWAME
ncbi:MAG TPA: helix-turn-helix domain-containing protein [Spirillospora sp.]|nr:helix-turn-helix domain-containing protein [Spirillospora sp.]